MSHTEIPNPDEFTRESIIDDAAWEIQEQSKTLSSVLPDSEVINIVHNIESHIRKIRYYPSIIELSKK